MNRTRQRPEQHNQDGSRTITVQDTNAENSTVPSTQEAPPVGVLQLRATDNTSKRVVWSEGTVDNEGMGKKKSKICCIYHKPKAFDESSDESSASDDSDSQSSDQEGSNYHSSDISDSEVNATKTLREKKGKGKAVQAHCGDDDCKANHNKQGKKKMKRTIKGTSTQTITITESSKDNVPLDGDHDPSHRTFKPNAYEKGNV